MREQNCKRQGAHNLNIGQRQAKGDIMRTLYELLLVEGPVTDKKKLPRMADLGTKFCKKAHMMVVGIISTGLQPAYN